MSLSRDELITSLRKKLRQLSKYGLDLRSPFLDGVAELVSQIKCVEDYEFDPQDRFKTSIFIAVTLDDEEKPAEDSIRASLPYLFEAVCRTRIITHIDNKHMTLTKAEHLSLIKSLKNLKRENHVDTLTIDFSGLSVDDFAEVVDGYIELFNQNPFIKHVSFLRIDTRHENNNTLIKIYDFLKTNTSIQTVSFAGVGYEANLSPLISVIQENKTLREISLDGHILSSEDKNALVNAYEQNHYLHKITFSEETLQHSNIPDILNNFALIAAKTPEGRSLPGDLWIKILSCLPEYCKALLNAPNNTKNNLKRHQGHAIEKEQRIAQENHRILMLQNKRIDYQQNHQVKEITEPKKVEPKKETESKQESIDKMIVAANRAIKRLNHWWWFNGRAKSKEIANAIAFIRENRNDDSFTAKELFLHAVDSDDANGKYNAGVSLRNALNKHRYTFLDPLRNKASLKKCFKKHETTRTLHEFYNDSEIQASSNLVK